MQTAPLFLEIAEAPENGVAYWIRAEDGARLRVGFWHGTSPRKGSVFIFPGRTEYIEKYGRTITDLEKFGYAALVIDWRGQGLADRATEDPMTGHVARFSDYHEDVSAMVRAATELDAPKPWFLVGHSLGACIGLRALSNGLPVSACAFTGPMWQISLPAIKRAAAWPLSWAVQAIGKGHLYAPGTSGKSYVLSTAFEDNRLTNDPEMYQYYIRQATTLPDHQIGGPSLGWLYQTLKETHALSKLPSPALPCIAFCGDQDEIIDQRTVQDRMAHWPGGKLERVGNARHDLFSEGLPVRNKVMADICGLFATVRTDPAAA